MRFKCPACLGGRVSCQAGSPILGKCMRCNGTGKESDADYKARIDSGWKP